MSLLKKIIEAVREECGVKKTENPKQPICNLHIDINGWQGKYGEKNRAEFLSKANKLRILRKFAGDFTVLLDGSLYSGFNRGLHKYLGEIDLDEISNLEISDSFEMRHFRYYNMPHIHGEQGRTFGDIHPDSLDDLKQLKLMCSPFSKPHYTLEGLYAKTGEDIDKRIEALENELLVRKGYQSQSIAENPKLIIKLLERKYKELVSNQ